MADLLKYRYVGDRDANGVPVNYLTHPLYGGIPARDLRESDVAGLHEEQIASIEASWLYTKVTQTEARSDAREGSDDPLVQPMNGNVSSPGLPEEQVEQVAPPFSAAAGLRGEVPAGPPTDAEAQMAVEAEAAADNPAIQDNPPVTRRGGRK